MPLLLLLLSIFPGNNYYTYIESMSSLISVNNHYTAVSTLENQFIVLPSECNCPDYINVYECTVMSTSMGVTIWKGTAFSCPNQGVLFPHETSFANNVTKSCNNGNIIGWSVGVENNNSYTSRLHVIVSSSTFGTTVGCTHDDGYGNITTIGSSFISNVSNIKSRYSGYCYSSKITNMHGLQLDKFPNY